MPQPVAQRRVRHAQRQRLEQERRRRRLAVLVALAIVAAVVVLLSAFGGGARPAAIVPAPASASRLLPSGPPQPEILANIDGLHLQLPIEQSRVTAIGYQSGSEGSLELQPVGAQANQGLLKRLVHTVFGGPAGRPHWYQLSSSEGDATSAIDVGALPGTDVYSPVDGTIVGLDDVVLNGRTYGSQIEIEPTAAPSLVVSVSHLMVDPSLAVGSPVISGSSLLGAVLDFSHAEKQALARYTNDAGNHVAVEVHPAATLQVP